MSRTHTFTAVVEFDAPTGLYVGYVPELPGAHTQAETLDELKVNLHEVVELVLEELAAEGQPVEPGRYVGTQQITVEVAA